MTWFGKTLAVLNIFGAVAFVVLGFMDFAKREAWAYANYVHDVAVNGLPLDDKVTDDRESLLLYDLSPTTKDEWFANSGGSVATQVEEVNRVKGLVDAKIAALSNDPAKQTAEYARILQPFARHNAEREWLIGVRTYLATPDDAAKLNKRLHDAFPTAVQAYLARPDDLTFPEAFTNACHALGGAPAQAFEQNLVTLLPAKPEKTFEGALKDAQGAQVPKDAAPEEEARLRALAFLKNLRDDNTATLRKTTDDPTKTKDTLDDVYAQALTAVHDQLKWQLDDLFDEAQNGPKSLADPTKNIRDAQRQAIAHLLFNMVEVLTDGAGDKGVFSVPDYPRFVSVVGLTSAIKEINDQAWLLQQLGEELQSARRRERGEFADAHRTLIADLQGRAVQLQYSMDLLDKKKQQLADEEAVVVKRRDDVKQAEDNLAEARAVTDKQMADLRAKSDKLHDMRIEGRDLLGDNLELERQIRELEKKR